MTRLDKYVFGIVRVGPVSSPLDVVATMRGQLGPDEPKQWGQLTPPFPLRCWARSGARARMSEWCRQRGQLSGANQTNPGQSR
jgi:hypothetical protein